MMMRGRYTVVSLMLFIGGLVPVVSAQEAEKKEVVEKIKGLELGAKLPELEVTSQDGKKVPLAAAEGDRWVFVFFYPKALTGG